MQATALLRTSSFTVDGRDARLARALRSGAIVRVRHGVYIDAGAWAQASPEGRMRLRAYALARVSARPPVFAFASAAALQELPLYGREDTVVHTLEAGSHPSRSRGDVIRHSGPLDGADIVERDGLRVTSLARTVFDVVRTVSAETALGCSDAALRAVAWRGWGSYDGDAAEQLRRELQGMIDAAPGARGIRQARFIVRFSDGRAQLPGESVSRLWMHRLGVLAPELQLEVAIGDGRRAFPDFAWPRLRLFGEFDGDGKYLDPSLTRGRSVRETLREQREREGALVAATGWAPVRWGSERLRTIDTFAAFLRAHGLLR